jgi:transglutaminase-like putative cysteine protease
MVYRVRHTTTYTYSAPVSVCYNELRLRPRDGRQQSCAFHELLVFPRPTVFSQVVDYFGNSVTFFTLQESHQALTMTANSRVTLTPARLPPVAATPPWEEVRDGLRDGRGGPDLEAYQCVFDSPYVATTPELQAYALPSFPPGRPLLDAVRDLTGRIYGDFTYTPRATAIHTPLQEVLQDRRGVCQDFAHVQIGCLRALGLAARYVSGYLVTPARLPASGAQASHAWVAVYCPGYGWIDIDPTNNVFPAAAHITLAYGRDYGDVSPIKGVFFGGGEHTMDVAVDVMPGS